MRKLGVAALLLLCALPGGAVEWEFVGDLGGTGGVLAAVADPQHGRLLLGTYYGYRIYMPTTGTWLVREVGHQGGGVFSFLPNESDSLALWTGRYNLTYWFGFIMDNAGLVAWGPLVWGTSDFVVSGLGRTPGPPETILACVGESILRTLDGGLTWDYIHPYSGSTIGQTLSVAPDGDVLVGYGVTQEPWALHGLLRSPLCQHA